LRCLRLPGAVLNDSLLQLLLNQLPAVTDLELFSVCLQHSHSESTCGWQLLTLTHAGGGVPLSALSRLPIPAPGAVLQLAGGILGDHALHGRAAVATAVAAVCRAWGSVSGLGSQRNGDCDSSNAYKGQNKMLIACPCAAVWPELMPLVSLAAPSVRILSLQGWHRSAIPLPALAAFANHPLPHPGCHTLEMRGWSWEDEGARAALVQAVATALPTVLYLVLSCCGGPQPSAVQLADMAAAAGRPLQVHVMQLSLGVFK
jgi:hypothetical protein